MPRDPMDPSIIYYVEKGENYDYNTRILYDYIHNNTRADIMNAITLSIVEAGNMSTIESAVSLFANLSKLTNIDLSSAKFDKCLNINNIFYSCTNLTSVSNFDISNVLDMANAFSTCINLSTIPNFDTSKVTNMSYAFSFTNLSTIPNFNTSKVTNMSGTFVNTKITTIPNLDTSNVTNMRAIFSTCRDLTSVSNFNTSKVIDARDMFSYCSNLHNYPSFNLDSAVYIQSMFGSDASGHQVIENLGPLVNLGKAFNLSTNNTYSTLDLYGIDGGTSYGPMTDNALSQLYNLSSASKNSQQILLQGEAYNEVSQSTKTTIASKGWYLVQMGNVCLTGDMKIQTPNGLIDIKDIKIGDKVYIYNEETKRLNTTEVSKIVNHNNLQIYTFTLSNGEQIKCTARHQFLVNSNHFDEYIEETDEYITVSKIDYMETRLIDLTDKFITKSGEEVTITNIEIKDNEQLVYEINTKTGNNYLLGEDSIIVKQEVIEA